MKVEVPIEKLYKSAELGLKYFFRCFHEKRDSKFSASVNVLEATILSSVAEMTVCEYLGKEFDYRNIKKHPDIIPNIQVKHTVHHNGRLALTKRFDCTLAPRDWIYVLVTGKIGDMRIVGWDTIVNLLECAKEPDWTPKTYSGEHVYLIVEQEHLRDPIYLKTNA